MRFCSESNFVESFFYNVEFVLMPNTYIERERDRNPHFHRILMTVNYLYKHRVLKIEGNNALTRNENLRCTNGSSHKYTNTRTHKDDTRTYQHAHTDLHKYPHTPAANRVMKRKKGLRNIIWQQLKRTNQWEWAKEKRAKQHDNKRVVLTV